MGLTSFLVTHFPYDSPLRRHGKWLYEELRTRARAVLPWKQLERVPPPSLHIETTNICNANCIFCAYQYQKVWRAGKGVMDDELFERVLREFKEMGGEEVSFTPIVGDPLVDPDIVHRIARVCSEGLTVSFFTNGILFNRIDVEALVKTGIAKIFLSTSPFDEQSHRAVYRTNHYSDLLNGVARLLRARNDAAAPLRVYIEFRSPVSAEETFNFPDFIDKIRPLLTSEEQHAVRIQTKGYDSWAGQIASDDLVGIMEMAIPPRLKNRPCLRTFLPSVLYDGTVRACSCIFAPPEAGTSDDGLTIGHLNDATFQEIWQGEKLRAVRRTFTTGKLLPVCAQCTRYRSC
ncbi:MAG: radical SAM protein [Candidatus Hydrogenedentes bacterium]|nr:radical SAM protein [Candidatus Hydrogenedentota bacterium]